MLLKNVLTLMLYAGKYISVVAATSLAVFLFVVYFWNKQSVAFNRIQGSFTASTDFSVDFDCGKTCSYMYDTKQNAEFYPLLRKQVNCRNIFRRMINPPYIVIKPPPRRPPPELLMNYTQNGECPLSSNWYLDNSMNTGVTHYNEKAFSDLLVQEKRRVINSYGGTNALNVTLWKYVEEIRDKHVVVIGTQIPWAEAMLINRGARKITTSEFNNLTVGHQLIEVTTPYKLANDLLKSGNSESLFDTAFSFSSIEHTGLGRYGDPIMPFGDLEAVAQVWCMVKPGGVFFLGIPATPDRKKCYYQWNAHRVYGAVRLQHLTANWKVLDVVDLGVGQPLIVLKKLSV